MLQLPKCLGKSCSSQLITKKWSCPRTARRARQRGAAFTSASPQLMNLHRCKGYTQRKAGQWFSSQVIPPGDTGDKASCFRLLWWKDLDGNSPRGKLMDSGCCWFVKSIPATQYEQSGFLHIRINLWLPRGCGSKSLPECSWCKQPR